MAQNTKSTKCYTGESKTISHPCLSSFLPQRQTLLVTCRVFFQLHFTYYVNTHVFDPNDIYCHVSCFYRLRYI